MFLIGLEVILKIRKQFQNIKHACDSEYKNIKCDVPQGSILDPLSFTLYVNDITNTTSLFEIILLADDTTFYIHILIIYSHPDISSKINFINKEL